MQKNIPRLGKGMAFFRLLDTNLLGVDPWVRIARFETISIPFDVTEIPYFGDQLFPISIEISEIGAINIGFEKMIWVIPEPSEMEQPPRGNWTLFDMWGINYDYSYGMYNLSETGEDPTKGRTFLIGSSFADNLPEGQLLIRAWGGRKRIWELLFYRVRATKFSLTLSRNEYQTFSLTVPAIMNPAYTDPVKGPDGLVVAIRSFEEDITKLA